MAAQRQQSSVQRRSKPYPESKASYNFQTLNPNTVLDPTYSVSHLLAHAIQLFFWSYPEMDYHWLTSGIYRNKLDEYVKVVEDIYDFRPTDTSSFKDWYNSCSKSNYVVIFAVKRFVGRSGKRSMFCVRDNNLNPIGEIALDNNTEVQENRYVRYWCSYDELRQMRRENAFFMLSVSRAGGGRWAFQDHRIDMGRIHPEGYQQWHDFGHGVRLLIEITYKLDLTSRISMRTVGNEEMFFHVHTLFRMIDRRLVANTRPNVWHKPMQMKTHRISYARPLVTESGMFWRTTHQKWSELRRKFVKRQTDPDAKQNIRQLSDRQTVLHIDIQRSLTYGEDIEGRMCLCNEWCNWNAFFHYNPIYRFLIVQNNLNFFDSDSFNIPEMYLYASVRHTVTRHANKGLVLPLVTSANFNRAQVSHRYMENFTDLNTYLDMKPDGVNALVMAGVSYNLLRYHTKIAPLIHQLDANPLSDFCIQNLMDHNNVMSDLHYVVSLRNDFVPQVLLEGWNRERNKFSRQAVRSFFANAYTNIFFALTSPDPYISVRVLRATTYDRVFGSDVEYLNYVPKNEHELTIKYHRMKALEWCNTAEDTANVFNMSVSLHPFLNCFKQCYKFFSAIDTQLPIAYTKDALQDESEYCIKFDKDFMGLFTVEPQIKFTVSAQELNSSGLSEDKHHWIYAFYTLKLYSFGFVMQEHCIAGRAMLLEFREYLGVCVTQIADVFQMIFDNGIIEQTYRSITGQQLFVDFFGQLAPEFTNFYTNFWTIPTPHSEYLHNCDSALKQYYKLYVWLKTGGDDKPLFTIILHQFGQCLWYVLDRSVQISAELVMPAIVWLDRTVGFQYSIEVWDVLALYLVRASCHCILDVVSRLFVQIHSLEDSTLVRQHMAFILCRPGWTPLLKTMDKVIVVLDKLRVEFIVYDDEIGRITESLTACQRLSKQFFKRMYAKLGQQWFKEIEKILLVSQSRQTPLTIAMINLLDKLATLHTAVGLSLLCAFANEHRAQFDRCRKNYFKLLERYKASTPVQIWVDSETTVEEYLKDKKAIRRGDSLQCKLWTEFLEQEMPFLNQMSDTDVGLDVSKAYVDN